MMTKNETMTKKEAGEQAPPEQEPREDDQDAPLELDDETLSDLTTDDDVVGGFSSECMSG